MAPSRVRSFGPRNTALPFRGSGCDTSSVETSVLGIDQLLPLFDPGRPTPVVLLGAGASVKSGVPLAGSLVEWAAKWRYCQQSHKNVDDPTVKRTDWMEFLHSQDWYRQDRRPEDNYFDVMQRLLVPKGERKEFFLWTLNRGVPASSGYEELLKLLDAGPIKTVLTTNFDRVLPDLKAARQRPHHLEVIRTPDECVAFSTSPIHPQLVYLHGAVEYYTDQTLESEIQALRPDLVNLLSPVLRDHPLIVMGYRGAEPSVMRTLLMDRAEFARQYTYGIYWCSLTATLHPLVVELEKMVHPNLQIVIIPGFDETFKVIAEHCERIPKRKHAPGSPRDSADKLPFDMAPIPEASLDELDWRLLKDRILAYCDRMKIEVPSDVTRTWLTECMCNFDLAARVGDKIVPTVAGYLLFGFDSSKRVKSAYTEVWVDGKNVRTIKGNLWVQKEVLDNLLEEINQPFILKSRNSEVVHPYPKIALRELCTNALVHRAYSGQGHLAVEVERNCVRLLNPGGLVEEVAERVQSKLQEHIESGATGIKGYRNAVVADIFCGAGAMEKKGSGLPDVHRSVTKVGGKVFFGPIDGNESFKAIVYRRPEEVDETTGTATPVSNVTRYSTNLLELCSMPQVVWTQSRVLVSSTSPEAPPSFAISPKTEISFSQSGSSGMPISTEELLSRPDGARHFTGLLNQCVYQFLEQRGLVVDRYRKRAYFPRTKDGSREIKYQASFRQATRTVTKPFISKASQRVLYWVHEAIWFAVERYAGQYVLRILPGYVFTTDGREALFNHKRVGALATRKASRDFSLQVFNHLVFWGWILSNGQDETSIQTGADPIVLKASFASCDLEVPVRADTQFEPDEYQVRSDTRLDELEQEIAEDAELTPESEDHATQH
jgi:hypothetical protein